MEFMCSICNYQSSVKCSVIRHINKQVKCGEGAQVIKVSKEINCEHCNKPFATKQNLNRHMKSCKIKRTNLEEENHILKQQVEHAKEQLLKLQSLAIKHISITNNTTNNIILKPENQNICIKNIRTKIVKVFDGTKWTTINEDKLLNDLISTYEGELENLID